MPLRLWVDDVRRPPDETWAWAKTVPEAISCLESGEVTELALDFDLHPFLEDGYAVCAWMRSHDVWPKLVHVITANRFGSSKMCQFLEASGYQKVPGRIRSFVRADSTKMSPATFAKLSHERSPNAMKRLR